MTKEINLKRQMLRNAEYYDMTEIYDKLYSDSLKGIKFINLVEIITNRNNILLAYRNIKRNSGSNTPGVDGKTIQSLAKMDTDKFIEIIQAKLRNYHPKPVKRVEIPKSDGKMRPLGIPIMIDRIIQQSVLQVMEPICEAKFAEQSNGFRPNRSCETAISQCYRHIQLSNLHIIVDVDIKGFFDNVNHGKLLKQMWTMGFKDKQLLSIISKMLKAPIEMPDKKRIQPTKGTPQGGILSPLLSNIVLNELDWWINSQWINFPTKKNYSGCINRSGNKSNGNKYRALRTTNLKEAHIVRYADDFMIFCNNHNHAEKVLHAIKKWLKDRLFLEVNEDKTKIINLKEKSAEFLGFKLRVVQKGNRYVVKSNICHKAMKSIHTTLKEKIKSIEKPKNELDEQKAIERYNAAVIGIHNYYSIATHVNIDCGIIDYYLLISMRKRIRQRLKKKGKQNGYVWERYGKSKNIRFIANRAVAPLSYVQTRKPLDKKSVVNKYTPEGRTAIHKSLEVVDTQKIIWLACNPVIGRSTEYNDNRLSLFAAQKGKCAILGLDLEVDDIHCHHINPTLHEKRDKYQNLLIVHPYIHKLIHINDEKLIQDYFTILKLNKSQITKLNEFRKKAGKEPI